MTRGWYGPVRRIFVWMTGVGVIAAGFVFAESWKIVMVKQLGYLPGTAIATAVTTGAAWVVIYLAGISRAGSFVERWVAEKKARLSERARLAVAGGQFLILLNTTILFGPIATSILMLMLGIRRRIYLYAFCSALLCQGLWCGVYSGAFWGLRKMIAGI